MDFDFNFAEMLKNPALWTLMGQAGKAMAGKDNPLGMTLGDFASDSGKAALMQRMWKEILGSGGKFTIDGEKTKIDMPTGAFQTASGGALQAGQGAQGLSAPTPTPTTPTQTPSAGGLGMPNPSGGSLDISNLNLAGLSPENVKDMLQLGLASEEIKRKKVSDLFQNAYWQELVKEKQLARGAKELAEVAPVDTPGVGRMTLSQWSKLSDKDRAYDLDMARRRARGLPDVDKREWEASTTPLEHARLLELYKTRPDLFDMEKQLRQAGAPSLGTLADRQLQTSAIKDKTYFKSQEFDDDFQKFVTNQDYINQKNLAKDPDAYAIVSQATWRENAIVRAGGKILDAKPGRGQVTFLVKWPDGRTEELSYGIRR